MASTIAAVATGNAPGGIGVIRISGDNAIEIAKKAFQPMDSSDITKLPGYRAKFGNIICDGEKIDNAVALVFRAPKSYTGEDVVELSVHGGMLLVQKTLKAVLAAGAVPAQAGEFTKRAFLNGKIDLTQAESVAELISAQGEESLKASFNALQGSLSTKINSVLEKLLDVSAVMAAWVDYPDEEIPELTDTQLQETLKTVKFQLKELLDGYETGQTVKGGVDTVIVGRPNVGKSSLMNMLSGTEKSIVTHIEGTTRDIVEGQKIYNGILYNFFDTAGIHETEELIEKIGIDKSIKAIEKADIILLLSDSGNFENQFNSFLKEQLDEKKVIRVMTKGDLGNKDWKEADLVISKDDESFNNIFSKIEEKLQIKNYEEPGLFSTRDLDLIDKLLDLLLKIKDDFKEEHSYDLMTIAMQEAYHLIKLLSGKEYNPDDIYDQVFSSFCVGK